MIDVIIIQHSAKKIKQKAKNDSEMSKNAPKLFEKIRKVINIRFFLAMRY
jgi:hypothetical protein